MLFGETVTMDRSDASSYCEALLTSLNTPAVFPPGHELSEKDGRKRVRGFQQRHVSSPDLWTLSTGP